MNEHHSRTRTDLLDPSCAIRSIEVEPPLSWRDTDGFPQALFRFTEPTFIHSRLQERRRRRWARIGWFAWVLERVAVGAQSEPVVCNTRTPPAPLVGGGEGHIVNTASMAGLLPGHSAYSASKWAVVGITEGLFQTMRMRGTGVGVSCLCPGWVDTQIDRSERNRPEWAAPGLSVEASDEEAAIRAFVSKQLRSGMRPDVVADLVHDAIVAGQFWIFTDDQMVQSLAGDYEAILTGTNPPERVFGG